MSKKSKDSVKRFIQIEGLDLTIPISKVTAIHSDKVPFLLHLDKLADGTIRLTYNSTVIPDLTQVKGFSILREDK